MWRTITAIAVSLVVPLSIEATGIATPRDHASHILIPAAISADGGNGTNFRSDIRITNLRGTPQLVVIYWLPAGVGGVEKFELVELQSGETLESDDFVNEVLTLLPEEYSVTVPGESVIQIPTSGVAQNQVRIDVVQAPVEGETTSSFWVAYASSVDNITGDGWTTVGANLDSRPGKIGGP